MITAKHMIDTAVVVVVAVKATEFNNHWLISFFYKKKLTVVLIIDKWHGQEKFITSRRRRTQLPLVIDEPRPIDETLTTVKSIRQLGGCIIKSEISLFDKHTKSISRFSEIACEWNSWKVSEAELKQKQPWNNNDEITPTARMHSRNWPVTQNSSFIF